MFCAGKGTGRELKVVISSLLIVEVSIEDYFHLNLK
jgi:hypothetical protein